MTREKTHAASPDDPAGPPKLPDAELEVLACLWQQAQATAREIREAMAGYRPMTHGSMVTLLKRLQAKGWVTRKKGQKGKAFIYRPTKCPVPTHRRIIKDLVRRIFGGNGMAVVSTLLDTTPPTPEQVDRLQELLDQLRRRAKEQQKHQ